MFGDFAIALGTKAKMVGIVCITSAEAEMAALGAKKFISIFLIIYLFYKKIFIQPI